MEAHYKAGNKRLGYETARTLQRMHFNHRHGGIVTQGVRQTMTAERQTGVINSLGTSAARVVRSITGFFL